MVARLGSGRGGGRVGATFHRFYSRSSLDNDDGKIGITPQIPKRRGGKQHGEWLRRGGEAQQIATAGAKVLVLVSRSVPTVVILTLTNCC